MGAAERGLLHQGLRYALALRIAVTGLASLVTLFSGSARQQAVAIVVVLAFNLWNGCFAYLMVRGADRRWLVPVDVAVVCAACFTQVWTTSLDPRLSTSWVLAAVEITVVAYPWLVGSVGLAGVTATILVSYFAGAAVSNPAGWLATAPVELWTAAEAALSWALYRFVRRSARAADQVVERAERLRRAAAVAGARRVDEREYLAALHDTASATLLMVGAGVVSGRERWLLEQAARDVEVMSGPAVVTGSEVDLLDLLRDAAWRTPLEIRWHGMASVLLPAVDAVQLSNGAREALTNVVRHAGTDRADIRVDRDGDTVIVEISDEGRGFDPAAVSGHHYGVTRSLVERMARTGGSALVDSRPGHGTRVRLTHPLSAREPAGDDAEIIATSFQQGLRWGVIVMCFVISLFLDLPKLLANQHAYSSVGAQFFVLGGLIAVTAVVAVVTWRGRSLGAWRWPLVLLVFGLSALATATVLPQYRLGTAHWSDGDAGWQIVLLLLDSRVIVFAGVLGAQYLMTFAQTALGGESALTLVGVVNATWIGLSYQLAVCMIAAVLRGLSISSAKAARAEEELRTSEAIAEQLHRDRKERFSGLADTTVPLLTGLANGELDPGDEAVRRSCAVEAARMRRLFAEDATGPDPLLHELRACIELAERNGVSVAFATCGARPEVPEAVCRKLTEPAIAALATARGKVRLTVAGAAETVTVSIVADCMPQMVPKPSGHGVRTDVLRDGDRLWIRATWRGES
ncbi:MAG TPA: ATP-binding protein [Actinophytocola sp.]|uniref:sensor histidine kinase n=1 Tax=Actinophytocola sp. TaxID=1872138 RepID=UPI002DB6B951|nr:ATP-binding protein [Actinophytocola sp.]HEU5475332.1 ATP-binding protein [Actinophytocola sp.]